MFNIQERLNLLKTYSKEQVWYIVKQEMEFWKVCYAVKILEEYQMIDESSENLESFFKRRANEIKIEKNFDKFITTHRMLLQGYMLGLMEKVDSQYKNAKVSEVFKDIERKCDGNFENVELYYDLIETQIEKVYFSSPLDEKRNDIRKQYRLYPLFLFYKVLVEIGKITGKYEVSRKEYVVFICTTERYSDYLSTVFNIISCRESSGLSEEVNTIYSNLSSDIRYHKLLTCLKTIKETDTGFKIDDKYIDYVKEKVYSYECSDKVNNSNYIKLLCSNESLVSTKDKKKDNIIEKEGDEKMDLNNIPANVVDENIAKNLIIYGAPGTGKSNKLEKEYREKYFNNEYLYSRVTFNPNYSYSDFLGVYKPTPIYVKEDNNDKEFYAANKKDLLEVQMLPVIDYSFVCGPFIEMLCRAINDNDHNYLLLIEEINRSDVASVFGDVFQLLDRDANGTSKYGIKFNKDIMNYIAGRVSNKNECFIKDELVKIPSNLYIWASMNSADQNVIKMDTAFKRRWEFEYISLNKYEDAMDNVYIKLNFLEGKIKWNTFRNKLNTYLSEIIEVTEDKLIGPFFINEIYEEDGIKYISESAFKYKLLSYLKDDVLRHRATELFSKNFTFGELINQYEKNNDIFVNDFTTLLKEEKDDN